MPPGIGVKRRNANQTMNAAFRFQPAVSIMAADPDNRGFNAGFFAVALFQQFDFVIVLFCPTGIHTQQDIRPILRFGAAGAGVQFQKGIVAVRFAAEQRFQFAFLDLTAQIFQRGFSFVQNGLIVFAFRQFQQFDGILQFLLLRAERLNGFFQPVTFG